MNGPGADAAAGLARLRLIALGSGSAFTTGADNFQSNFLLEAPDGARLMIDCGSDARHALQARGLGPLDIPEVYITHLHSDHVGGLEWLGFSTLFTAGVARPKLHLLQAMIEPLWTHVLSGTMRAIPGPDPALETYFDIAALSPGIPFVWQGAEITPVPVYHVFSAAHGEEPCAGLQIRTAETTLFLTADTRFTPDHLAPWYEAADVILHDCELGPRSGVHSHWLDLCSLPERIRAKMWLYHYPPEPLPDAKAAGFCGFVRRGQEFTLLNPAADPAGTVQPLIRDAAQR